jgi:hypothetical protein
MGSGSEKNSYGSTTLLRSVRYAIGHDWPNKCVTRWKEWFCFVFRLETVYKPYSFWINMAEALYQSLILFFLSYGRNTLPFPQVFPLWVLNLPVA